MHQARTIQARTILSMLTIAALAAMLAGCGSDAATDDKTSAVRPRGSQSLYARIRMGAPQVPRSDTLSAAVNLLAQKLQKSTL